VAKILSSLRHSALAALSALLCCFAAIAQPDGAQNGIDGQPSTADRVYASARPRLLQIRTLLDSAGRQASLGSGFLISADGLAVTNYHVVSQYALEPATYRLEYAAPDGSHGAVKLRAIDVVNDLAVVQLEPREDDQSRQFFAFNARALEGNMPKGQRIYSMGNPLDLGFTIVDGTYNGLVERTYNERIHFSGAINPGMSGGPVVTTDGEIVGVNVAKHVGGELVSFLVPARFAKALVDRARSSPPLTTADSRKEIGRQLGVWQAGLYQALGEQGFRTSAFGPYVAPESNAPWFTCWARTNADVLPKPRALASTTNCSMQTSLFIAGDLQTGQVDLAHSYVRSIDLNAFQFSAFLSRQYQPSWFGTGARSPKRLTAQQCHEDFIEAAADGAHPMLRAVWCARAYREFEDLYDVSVIAVTQDRSREALISRLSMQGVTYSNAMALAKRFLGAVSWAK
jgi:S1-C subfamily serine protease